MKLFKWAMVNAFPCFLILSANPSFADLETKYSCVGTYLFAYDDVRNNQLVDLTITRFNDEARVILQVSNHHIDSDEKDTDKFSETDTHITAKKFDTRYGHKVLIRYDKIKKEVLMVSNYENGNVNKFDGECY